MEILPSIQEPPIPEEEDSENEHENSQTPSICIMTANESPSFTNCSRDGLSPKQKKQKLNEFRRDSKQLKLKDIRDLRYELIDEDKQEFKFSHLFVFFFAHLLTQSLGYLSAPFLLILFGGNVTLLRNMRILACSKIAIVVNIIKPTLFLSLTFLYIFSQRKLFQRPQLVAVVFHIAHRAVGTGIKYAYMSSEKIKMLKERQMNICEVRANNLANWVRGMSDCAQREIKATLRRNIIEGKSSKLYFIVNLRPSIKSFFSDPTITQAQFYQQLRQEVKQERKKKEGNRRILRKTSSYAAQQPQSAKVLYSGHLSLEDLNTGYSIERVALAFYYGSLSRPPKLKRIVLLGGFLLIALMIVNVLFVRGQRTYTYYDIGLFFLAFLYGLLFTGFNIFLLAIARLELKRKKSYMRIIQQMLIPGQYIFSGNLPGLIPTANIFSPQTLLAWYELRVLLLQMGKRYMKGLNAYMAASVLISLIIGLMEIFTWLGGDTNFDGLIYTVGLWVVLLFILGRMMMEGAKVNQETLKSKDFLLKLKRLAFTMQYRPEQKEYETSTLRHMVAVWKLYGFTKKDLPEFISAVDTVVELLEQDSTHNAISVLGMHASYGYFGATASFVVSIGLGLLLSYFNLQ